MLCYEFFCTGLFAVGGGLATLPFLTEMSRQHPDWFSAEMLGNMVAVSESTPGPIGVNMSTYVGYTVAGIPGALCATLSLVFPSVVVIMLVARMLQRFKKNKLVQNTFSALHPAVTGLIAAAGYSVLQMAVFRADGFGILWVNAVMYVLLLALMYVPRMKKIHPAAFIAIGAVAGVLLGL